MEAGHYRMDFVGRADSGTGLLYIGHGIVHGLDGTGVHYDGSYQEQGATILMTCTMHVPEGVELVTGERAPKGMSIPISAIWPTNFANGEAVSLLVHGQPVNVGFTLLRHLP